MLRIGLGIGARRGVVSAADKAKKLEQQQLDALERMASTPIPADFDLKSQKITVLGMSTREYFWCDLLI